MKWSRIQDTSLAEKANIKLYDNEVAGCYYHNAWHVNAMYNYLDKTNEPYDEALDWAVLFHDIVYDNQPEKEKRSAEEFVNMTNIYQGCNLDFYGKLRVVSMIHATQDHSCKSPNDSAIIRADLHALTDPVQVFRNFNLILEESMYLYRIDEKTFADNNIRFMGGSHLGGDDRGLYGRVEKNMETDPLHRDFYNEVKRGIVSTINLSRILKGDL